MKLESIDVHAQTIIEGRFNQQALFMKKKNEKKFSKVICDKLRVDLVSDKIFKAYRKVPEFKV